MLRLFLQQTPAEMKEFFNAIPSKNYIYSLLMIISILLYKHLTNKFNIQFYRNKALLTVFIVFAMLKQAPFAYINHLFIACKEVKNELTKLNESAIANKWGKSTLKNSTYDTYVLIVGESARKDYHHAFGYPINNTPFMSNAKGILVDGLTSGGSNTITSLRLMLTKSDKKWQPNYNLNFIDLAKQAGIETYWLSNQGYIGEFDTPISVIAKRSSHAYFTKYGSYDAKNTSDFLLLDHIQRIVNQNEKKKKLIVVHLLGSHPNACERVVDYKKIINSTNKTFSYINCYISSIKKTDEFIKQTYNMLNIQYKEKNSTFSLVYFSDHGLIHQKVNDIIYLNNSSVSKLHYDIPLFKISSDSKERKFCKSFKSGLNFTDGIGNWLGIVNANLDKDSNLFDCISDKNDYGLFKKIEAISSPADYAINISVTN